MSRYSGTANRQLEASGTTNQRRYSVVSSRQVPKSQPWRFGFRHFRQIENFGLSAASIKNSWLLSVLERFAELGNSSVDDILNDKRVAEANRCHEINWEQKNIPISIDDLDWIPEKFHKREEYPILQFAVSKAMGRLLGFFDEEWTFQVVLLDPLHNAQPSKSYGYKVDPCSPLGCEITALRKRVDDSLQAINCECGLGDRLTEALHSPTEGPALIICISRNDLPEQLEEVLESGMAASIQDVLQAGIDHCLSR